MDLFHQTLILIASAVLMVGVARRIKLPPILGYIVVGTLIGPYGLGWVPERENFDLLAEFGIVFLMFTVGLEFSLPRLISMRGLLLGLGGAQVIITTLIAAGIALLVGLNPLSAFIIAASISLSSTAICIKQLYDRNELHERHGKLATSILLFQDIAAILILISIPEFANPHSTNILVTLLVTISVACLALALMIFLGKWLIRPIFHEIAKASSSELFILTALLITTFSAWASIKLGLSMVFGAFVAGLMLGETEYRHQLEIDIRPFRDVLLGLFFITVGMLINLKTLLHYWQWVLFLTTAIIVGKAIIIFLLTRFTVEKNSVTALRNALLLAQSGEFGFAIFALTSKYNLLDGNTTQITLASIALSMAIAPIIIHHNHIFSLNILLKDKSKNKLKSTQTTPQQSNLCDHVIICGFGKVGKVLSHFLELENLSSIALDLEPKRIQHAKLAGEKLFYGDASRQDMLNAAGLARAKLLIISFDKPETTKQIITMVREQGIDIPILVRTRDETFVNTFKSLGATEVVPETIEASLMLAMQMLLMLNKKPKEIFDKMWDVKKDRYEILRK